MLAQYQKGIIGRPGSRDLTSVERQYLHKRIYYTVVYKQNLIIIDIFAEVAVRITTGKDILIVFIQYYDKFTRSRP